MYSFLHPPILGTERTVSSMLGNRPGFPFYFVWHTLALFFETRSHCIAQDSFQLRFFSASGSHVLGYHICFIVKYKAESGWWLSKGLERKAGYSGREPKSHTGQLTPASSSGLHGLLHTSFPSHPPPTTNINLKKNKVQLFFHGLVNRKLKACGTHVIPP